jgi:signal transduction histidine kinase
LAFIIKSQYTDVVMDKTLLRYILSNLLTNAVKYSPGGGTVQLEIHCGTDQTVIRVADEGIGIPEKDQKRLFEAFHRAQNVGAIKGSGLGLTITKRAVMLHGGSIHFESQVGVGTTFTVTLPTAMEQHNDEDSRN